MVNITRKISQFLSNERDDCITFMKNIYTHIEFNAARRFAEQINENFHMSSSKRSEPGTVHCYTMNMSTLVLHELETREMISDYYSNYHWERISKQCEIRPGLKMLSDEYS